MSEQKPELINSNLTKLGLTGGQKRLLAVVYIMGGVLIILFVGVVLGFIWQLAKLH